MVVVTELIFIFIFKDRKCEELKINKYCLHELHKLPRGMLSHNLYN